MGGRGSDSSSFRNMFEKSHPCGGVLESDIGCGDKPGHKLWSEKALEGGDWGK